MPEDLARALILAGLCVAALGGILLVAGHLGLGRLPGDLHFRRGHVSVSVPLATGLVLSIAATLILNLIGRR
jgi:hypothetical protein